jgi:hypothetical protein
MSNGSLTAGGCADGLSPVVQGFILEDKGLGCQQYCYDIHVRSPDMAGGAGPGQPDGLVNIQDLSKFATHYPPGAAGYDTCADLDCNATINLQDLARFAFHYGPPGHECN